MIRVSAGIIRRADGHILICQRGPGRHNAHLWEFPGGKQEDGETPAACLARELREELSLTVRDIRPYETREAEGLTFDFLLADADGEPVLTEHEDAAFVAPRELARYAFCPADAPVALALALALRHPPLTDFFWDFDGTLMDTYPAMVTAMERALTAQGVAESPDRLLTLMKDSLGRCVQVIADAHGLDARALTDAFRREEAPLLPDAPPMPGIAEALTALHRAGCRHYLVTHRDKAALTALDKAGLLPLFTDAVTAEDGFPRKPAPDSLLALIRSHGLDPNACVMLGDRPLDIRAGQAAGTLTCLIDPDGRFPDEPCTLRRPSAHGLAELLRPQATQDMNQQEDRHA